MKIFLQKSIILKIFFVFFIVAIGIMSFLVYKKVTIPPKYHIHAGFVIFKDNKKLDFSNLKYMKVEPCTEDEREEEETPESEQIEKAHLHDNIGDVVHVENKDALWKDLLTNLKYSVDKDKVKAYSNGIEIRNFLDTPIIPFQSVVIFDGNSDPSYIKDQVPLKYIKSKVKTSENCG